jgi:2-dehydropantoate 2-reductase
LADFTWEQSSLRTLVVGGGAIGGIVGSALDRAGEDVALVDVDAAHLEAIQRDGMTIQGYPETHTVRLEACRPEQVQGSFDLAFLVVKSQHTAAAVEPIVDHLAPHGCVVSLQNGINETFLAERLGAERVLGAVIHLAADQIAPGQIIRHAQGEFFLGELNGAATPRLERVRRQLEIVAPTTVSDNILGWLWTKQIYGCLLVASALADETISEQLGVPYIRTVYAALLAEATVVALAEGIRLEELDIMDPLDLLPSPEHGTARAFATLDTIAASSMKGKSGMWRDIKMKGRKSESDHITGYVVERARRHGISTPVNAAVLARIQEIEAGTRTMTLEHFTALAEVAHGWEERAAAAPVSAPTASA